MRNDPPIRVGIGYDVHKLVPGRDLILGGELIDYNKGLLGYSDADVLTHAIMDALLGAMCWGDIGKVFPTDNPELEGARSLHLLERINDEIKRTGRYRIGNIDAVIIADAPVLSPYRYPMQRNIALCLDLSIDCVSVKMTTEEGLGYAKKGIAAQAIATLIKTDNPRL